MSLHDEYARRTPLEIVFPDFTALERLSKEAAEEARGRGLDAGEPEVFMTLATVAERVRSLGGPDAPPESKYPLASLLYHGVRFVGAGAPHFQLDRAAARHLVATAPDGAAARPPATAGYLQFPQHLLWSQGAVREGGAESLDGVFWTLSASGMLHALTVSGLRPDRPGFGALPLPAAPFSDASRWLAADVRPRGEDFASELPGAELDELYAVETAGELLKLLARFFVLSGDAVAVLDARPAATSEPEASAESTPGAPRPSVLPYTRVSLVR